MLQVWPGFCVRSVRAAWLSRGFEHPGGAVGYIRAVVTQCGANRPADGVGEAYGYFP